MLLLYCSFALSFTHGRRLPSRLVNARDTLVTCTKNVKKWKNFSLSVKEAGEVKEQNSIHVSCSLTHLPVNGNELARRKFPTKEKKQKQTPMSAGYSPLSRLSLQIPSPQRPGAQSIVPQPSSAMTWDWWGATCGSTTWDCWGATCRSTDCGCWGANSRSC
jgi:hypothetical protein